MKALDYEDVIVRGWHVYNLCRAKTREGCTKTCGLYFPGKLWSRPNKNNWKFFCCLDWDILIEHKDTSDECARWVGNLRKEYGDKENWPQIGCGSKFVPWKRGPSMVAELMMEDGTWSSFLCERPPNKLVDAIFAKMLEFFDAAAQLQPDQILDMIPITFPMKNILNTDLYPGVGYFNVENAAAMQDPYFQLLAGLHCVRKLLRMAW